MLELEILDKLDGNQYLFFKDLYNLKKNKVTKNNHLIYSIGSNKYDDYIELRARIYGRTVNLRLNHIFKLLNDIKSCKCFKDLKEYLTYTDIFYLYITNCADILEGEPISGLSNGYGLLYCEYPTSSKWYIMTMEEFNKLGCTISPNKGKFLFPKHWIINE